MVSLHRDTFCIFKLESNAAKLSSDRMSERRRKRSLVAFHISSDFVEDRNVMISLMKTLYTHQNSLLSFSENIQWKILFSVSEMYCICSWLPNRRKGTYNKILGSNLWQVQILCMQNIVRNANFSFAYRQTYFSPIFNLS